MVLLACLVCRVRGVHSFTEDATIYTHKEGITCSMSCEVGSCFVGDLGGGGGGEEFYNDQRGRGLLGIFAMISFIDFMYLLLLLLLTDVLFVCMTKLSNL